MNCTGIWFLCSSIVISLLPLWLLFVSVVFYSVSTIFKVFCSACVFIWRLFSFPFPANSTCLNSDRIRWISKQRHVTLWCQRYETPRPVYKLALVACDMTLKHFFSGSQSLRTVLPSFSHHIIFPLNGSACLGYGAAPGMIIVLICPHLTILSHHLSALFLCHLKSVNSPAVSVPIWSLKVKFWWFFFFVQLKSWTAKDHYCFHKPHHIHENSQNLLTKPISNGGLKTIMG